MRTLDRWNKEEYNRIEVFNMVATYQVKSSELSQNFLKSLQDMFQNCHLSIRIEAKNDKNDDEFVYREGVAVPRSEINDPFYSTENLRWLKNGINDLHNQEDWHEHELIET
jgi:hypothetical protein